MPADEQNTESLTGKRKDTDIWTCMSSFHIMSRKMNYAKRYVFDTPFIYTDLFYLKSEKKKPNQQFGEV